MADELEREILAMETRLLEVKLTMEAEKVNWERANKPTKKTGTHWKRAARTPQTSAPPVPVPPAEKPRAPKRSMTALLRQQTSEWNTTDVVAWLEHLQFLELARLAGASGINGAQLLSAHLGLSDLHLRQLFRISLVDSSWKAFVREVASLHRRHVEMQQQLTPPPRMTPNDVSLPTIAPPTRKQKRVKKTQPMAACWICAKAGKCLGRCGR
ncbi:hypothetical protein SPRG_18448 [Saprolegnia parasitica CBS 223.65]|uniref:SAM domain-containing protein n=1 Tax=Saprolegnia parasitica (strain CBS 223.65) TaxID=695850 RepID=A0A067BNU6_SAPPC|nr:hypothetical protein SPRG_18448 [Saprolegnia parasitica CBS 223.65]KDO16016.1 hypothetical protein SPRG_18448 [Saprolegnia parasitica CBS 223.65]|eukprot:XP_012213277.1 hypothetical protein SPRG_18448 [Saprolegnia parasitica CBS 223.65]